MSGTLFPVDSVDSAPSYTGEMLRQVLGVLLGGHTPDRPLGAHSGVVAGVDTSSVVSATSTTWTVTPFAAVLDVQDAAAAGPYLAAFDSDQTGDMTAADANNPRVDLISVQVSDPAEDSTTTPGVAIVYTAGTAASSPSVPDTPDRALALAKIAVPKSGGGDPTVTWLAPRTPPGPLISDNPSGVSAAGTVATYSVDVTAGRQYLIQLTGRPSADAGTTVRLDLTESDTDVLYGFNLLPTYAGNSDDSGLRAVGEFTIVTASATGSCTLELSAIKYAGSGSWSWSDISLLMTAL